MESIGKIIPHPAVDPIPLGLQGDIKANGFIDSIFSTGPIGASNSHMAIESCDQVTEIRPAVENGRTSLDDLDAFVHVKADTRLDLFDFLAA